MKKYLLILLVLILSGCSLPGLGGSVSSNAIVIGSGNTTERQILSEIISQLIKEEMQDIDVEIINNLGSSVLIFQALRKENVNVSSAMYTGTSLLGELEMDPISDPVDTFETVVREYYERFDATWFPSYGFENTYAFMVTKEFAQLHNLTKISDLEPLADQLNVGVDGGWIDRPLDGYDELQDRYGFSFNQLFPMEIGLVYSALDTGQLQVALGYSTDGRIDAFDLVVLEDDRHHFPSYSVSPVVSNQLLERYPEIEKYLLKLEGEISVEKMQLMNRQSDELGDEPKEVATQFLLDNNYFRDKNVQLLDEIPLYNELRKGVK